MTSGSFSSLSSVVELQEFRNNGSIPEDIKKSDERWRAIRIHARTRNISRKFRTFEEAAEKRWKSRGWRRFVTWLGRQTDLSFRLHGGLLGGRGVHYSSLIQGGKSEGKLEGEGASEWAKWDASEMPGGSE